MPRTRAILLSALAALGIGCAVATSGPTALACMIDSQPSISANGQVARPNLQPPTTEAQLALWAPFVFTRSYQAGTKVVFTENRQEVAQSLVPAAMLRSWRWNFGDGNSATGWTVHHRYSKPGVWLISVDAYFPSTGKWYLFDKVNVRITGTSARTRQS